MCAFILLATTAIPSAARAEPLPGLDRLTLDAPHRPKVIEALFEDSVSQGIWLKKNLRQAAELIAPLQGLPVEVVELALQRYEFNVKPITPAVAADLGPLSAEVAMYALMAAVLSFRPAGLFSAKG